MQTKQRIVILLQSKELPHHQKAKSCNKPPKFTKSTKQRTTQTKQRVVALSQSKKLSQNFQEKYNGRKLKPI
jgi:predicted FMN-binding regulatory protein PaiB